MKKTFFIGNSKKYKIDVDFAITGKEQIFVDNVLVINKRNFSMKEHWTFNAGDHEVTIKYNGNFNKWSCPVYVDGVLFMKELFEEELVTRNKRISNFPKFIKIIVTIVFISLLLSFLKGLYHGLSGG